MDSKVFRVFERTVVQDGQIVSEKLEVPEYMASAKHEGVTSVAIERTEFSALRKAKENLLRLINGNNT